MAAGDDTRVVATALAASAAGAAVRLAAAAWTGSSAMLAEAVHALVAAGSQGLTLLGITRAGRAAAARDREAAVRELQFWTLVVAILMYALGAGVALYEGLSQLIARHSVTDPLVATAGLAVALALSGVSAVKTRAELARRREAAALAALREPVLFTVLIQTAAAVAGLAIAAAGVALSYVTGSSAPDGCAAVAIGLLLGAVAAVMSLEVRRLLVGRSEVQAAFFIEEPDPDSHGAVEDHAATNQASPRPAPRPPSAPAQRNSRKERKRRKHSSRETGG